MYHTKHMFCSRPFNDYPDQYAFRLDIGHTSLLQVGVQELNGWVDRRVVMARGYNAFRFSKPKWQVGPPKRKQLNTWWWPWIRCVSLHWLVQEWSMKTTASRCYVLSISYDYAQWDKDVWGSGGKCLCIRNLDIRRKWVITFMYQSLRRMSHRHPSERKLRGRSFRVCLEENNPHLCPDYDSGVWCIGGMMIGIGKQCSDKNIISRPKKKLTQRPVYDTERKRGRNLHWVSSAKNAWNLPSLSLYAYTGWFLGTGKSYLSILKKESWQSPSDISHTVNGLMCHSKRTKRSRGKFEG
jgi:hypothetical protein